MVFNNINVSRGYADERSSVVMLDPPAPDPATGVYAPLAPALPAGGYRPAAPFWSWDKRGFAANHISGAQMLGNGNVVITNGENGDIVEVTAAGDVVWEFNWTVNSCATNHPPRPNRSVTSATLTLTVPRSPPAGGGPHYPPVGNCFFRTYRYPASYPGLKEHAGDLVTPVECDPADDTAIPGQRRR